MKLSKISILFTVLMLGCLPASMAAEGWMTDFPAAQTKATGEGKPLLLDFTGSDWCGWCIRLDREVFSQAAFKDFAASELVLVELDFPRGKKQSAEVRAQNEALAAKYGVEGFPTLILLSAEGDVLARTGYREGGAEAYVEHLQALLAKK